MGERPASHSKLERERDQHRIQNQYVGETSIALSTGTWERPASHSTLVHGRDQHRTQHWYEGETSMTFNTGTWGIDQQRAQNWFVGERPATHSKLICGKVQQRALKTSMGEKEQQRTQNKRAGGEQQRAKNPFLSAKVPQVKRTRAHTLPNIAILQVTLHRACRPT